jgi:hypothetical protein
MENQEGPGTVVEIASTRRRKAPTRRPGASKTPATARKPRKTAVRGKAPAKRRRASSASVSIERLIRSIAGGAAIARAALAEASGEGAIAVRRAASNATRASRKTVTKLAQEWRALEPRRKARLLAALLGAAAAASVPLVRRSLKK